MKPGAKPRRGFPYGSAEWRDLRRKALVRDRFRCSRCQAKGRRLTVDHIEPVDTHPHLAWQLSNLRVLCADCDNKRHAEKGHGNRPFGCDLEGRPLDPLHPWNTRP